MLAYYPGCTLSSSAREFGLSSEALLKKLGIEYREIEDWNCCGATSAHTFSENLSLAAAYRNLVLAEKTGTEMMTPCSICSARLKTADYWFNQSSRKRDWLLKNTGLQYSGKLKIEHMAELLLRPEIREKLKKEKTHSLNKVKIAVYYGCLLVRPQEIIQFDDPNDPSRIDDLLADLGAETVDWSHKTECCGSSFGIADIKLAYELSYKILNSARKQGADCLVAVCPLCQGNLDMRQKGMEKEYNRKLDLPVFYLPQLIGLSLGISPRELALTTHAVDAMKLVNEKIL
ncbi:MAG: CoB--CoM heterodisulfide reductase iron-sulfur subunit B family protein [bacterium]